MIRAIIEDFLSRLRWYRRWRGGHWEKWWIGPPVNSEVWLQIEHGERVGPYCMRDACEDYTPPVAIPNAGHPYR